MSTVNNRLYHVLLVEDNPGDVRLTQEAFSESKRQIALDVVNDGIEAVSYLRKEGPYADKPTPDLVLMDLNLPKWDGREVLKIVKNDENLRRIPVVILTTSSAPRDVQHSYDLHANSFVNKPVDFDQFFDVIQKIEEFWLATSVLPASAT